MNNYIHVAHFTDHYNQPGRYYHNWLHIRDCLEKLERLTFNPISTIERGILEEALLWHDYVYDAKRSDNEMMSAIEYALYVHNNKGRAREVLRLILLTKDHIVDPVDTLGSIMVSIDLSSLGANPEQFAINRANIRKEFAHASEPDFLKGTMTFYEKMLKREVIFPFKPYRDVYEEQSRRNMVEGYVDCRRALEAISV